MKPSIARIILNGIIVATTCLSVAHGDDQDDAGGTLGLYLENDLFADTDQHYTRTGAPADPRPMKVVKHLFDVGELAAIAENLVDAVQTYQAVHAEQLRWGRDECTIGQALDDTQEAAFWVCRRDLIPPESHERIDFFGNGIRALDSHLFNQPFQIAESRLAAARAALVAECIRQEQSDFDLQSFLAAEIDLEAIREANLDGAWINLNRLKKTDPKAFECWLMAQILRRPS